MQNLKTIIMSATSIKDKYEQNSTGTRMAMLGTNTREHVEVPAPYYYVCVGISHTHIKDAGCLLWTMLVQIGFQTRQ